MEYIILEKICKSYERKQVLFNVTASIPIGKVTCIMAPSGKGKTTLLKILMGLEKADKGNIFGLENLKKSVVFQENRLLEHLNPVTNIRFANHQLEIPKIVQAMNKVGLSECTSLPVRDLSGGMKRRVAILRALLADYDILFMDEPFIGLDNKIKIKVIEDIRDRSKGYTVLFVTHDLREAKLMETENYIYLT
ncbi:ABC transporter ATP-binding protein [bacterium 1XD42-8]|jgi:NitT/TauT family transport system ATP-binding protein|nr:ABC transporter ATP-binding protein [Lachnospiraceae bacterium]RKJ33823.1 ABC transporter ATP-binding protein [bacterium 1XD42-8]